MGELCSHELRHPREATPEDMVHALRMVAVRRPQCALAVHNVVMLALRGRVFEW